jgi:hypothetical protein
MIFLFDARYRGATLMLKPICFPCQRFYRPEKNGFVFLEGMPEGNYVLPGTEDAARWRPYKLWAGDKWKCQGCGHEIIVGTGARPIAIQHEDSFAEQCEAYLAEYQVNDC